MALFDTDVLIWALRGNTRAARAIDGAHPRQVSVVSYMELVQGARDKREIRLLRSFLMDLGFDVLPLTENIGHRASVYMEEFALKSGLTMADALLASTAVENQSPLCSANVKHLRAISEMELMIFRPQ